MDMIFKAARIEKAAVGERELVLINAQALRELSAEEVFTFRLAACDNQIDRDCERFTEATLEQLSTRRLTSPSSATCASYTRAVCVSALHLWSRSTGLPI